MPWTFEQRIQRACDALVARCLLEETQIENLRRPMFFGQYAYGVGLSLELNQWGEWVSVKDMINHSLRDLDMHLQSNQRTYQFNAFSSDPRMIRWLIQHQSMFSFNHVRIIERSHWHLTLPKPKPKGKFYGEYGYRFEFKDPKWGLNPENIAELEKLSGHTKLVTSPRTFLYLDKLNDVLLFKLIVGEQLLSLDDRHDL